MWVSLFFAQESTWISSSGEKKDFASLSQEKWKEILFYKSCAYKKMEWKQNLN